MVTGCGCHDPAVFGHQAGCALGPRLVRPIPVSWRDLAEERVLDSRLAELAGNPMPASEWRIRSARIID